MTKAPSQLEIQSSCLNLPKCCCYSGFGGRTAGLYSLNLHQSKYRVRERKWENILELFLSLILQTLYSFFGTLKCHPIRTLGSSLKSSLRLRKSLSCPNEARTWSYKPKKFHMKIPIFEHFAALESWMSYFPHFRSRTLYKMNEVKHNSPFGRFFGSWASWISLPLAYIRCSLQFETFLVTLSSRRHCKLLLQIPLVLGTRWFKSQYCSQTKQSREMAALGFEPRAAGWEARTLPLCYGTTPELENFGRLLSSLDALF